jgi:hypothetical protein
MTHAGTNVREISLMKSGTTAEGFAKSEAIIFRRNGEAERSVRVRESADQVRLDTRDAGQISTDTFERLVRVIDDNGFEFKINQKREGPVTGGLTVITVTSDEGSQDLIADPQDPQIQNILTAIENVEKDAAWRPMDN